MCRGKSTTTTSKPRCQSQLDALDELKSIEHEAKRRKEEGDD